MTEFIKNQQPNFSKQIDKKATGQHINFLRKDAGFSVKKLANLLEFESDQDGFEEKVSEIIAQAAMLEDA